MFRNALIAAALALASAAALPASARAEGGERAVMPMPAQGSARPAAPAPILGPGAPRLPEPHNGQVSMMIQGALLYLSRR